MIFNRKNVDLETVRSSRGRRRYTAGDPTIVEIICTGEGFRPDSPIRYWKCHIFLASKALDAIPKYARYKKVFGFIVDRNKWYDKWFLESLEEAMQKGGKYKLIKAIYNDFD